MQREAFIVSEAGHRAMRALNYTPAVEALRRARASKTVISIGDAVSELGLGYATVFARIDCAPEHGIELLSQSDMFGTEPAGRWIRRDSMNRPERHEVRRWQILIAGAGTLGENELYGRPIIADGRLAGKYVGQDTLVLAFDPPGSDLNLYVYAFLASQIGLKAIRSASYGTKILRVRKDILRELPIPSADSATTARIAGLIRAAIKHRERYAKVVNDARGVLQALPEMREALEMCSDRRARCVVWSGGLSTMSAWTFASTGKALAHLLARWPARLAEVLPAGGVFRGNRFARIPCEAPYGVDLVSQRDAFLVRPVPQRVLIPGANVARLSAPAGTVLAGGQGTLGEGEIFGRVALVTPSLDGTAISEHLLRIQPNVEARPLVYAFLSTLVGRRLLRSTAVGTKLLSLRPDLVGKLPIPSLTSDDRAKLFESVSAALNAHESARKSEVEAIRIIEEEVLPQWLA